MEITKGEHVSENESGRVRMTHPDMKDAEAFFQPDAVPVHEAAGWKLAKAPAASTEKKG